MKRPHCPTCRKAASACICHTIQTLPTNLDLWILQSPKEAKHPLGTARILELSIPSCKVLVGEDFSKSRLLNDHLDQYQDSTWLLYPGPGATPLAQMPQGSSSKQSVIILDATWKKARKIYLQTPRLARLQALSIQTTTPSRYTIRKGPGGNHLSTVEAAFEVLSHLEQNKDRFQPLLDSFEAMIQHQLKHISPELQKAHYGISDSQVPR